MTRLAFPAYLDHLRTESRRFRDTLTDCDPSARVPACPDWDAADLLWHLAEVQWSWAATIRSRPAPMQEAAEPEPERPQSYAELLEAFDDFSGALATELERADPAEQAWSWAPEQTVGFSYRRQAHEALVHRVDAEQTAGRAVTPLDPVLAADGVDECLAVMYGGSPHWGTFTPGTGLVRVDLTDVAASVWVQLGRFTGTDPDNQKTYDEDDVSVVSAPDTDPDVVIAGSAGDVNTWLWRRRDDAGITVSGDRSVDGRFRAITDNPIN